MMTQSSTDRFSTPFGIPLGELSLFACVLMGTAIGFAAFFASTFVGIISLLGYITFTHRPASAVDFSLAYRSVGLPIGLVVLALSLGYFLTMWTRRKLKRG